MESRIKELARMGFKRVYVPKDSFIKKPNIEGIDIVQLKTLSNVIKHVYS